MKKKHKKKKKYYAPEMVCPNCGEKMIPKSLQKYRDYLARIENYVPQTGPIAGFNVIRCKIQTAKPIGSDGFLDIKRMLEIMEVDEKAFPQE